jgi:hypothetical protein
MNNNCLLNGAVDPCTMARLTFLENAGNFGNGDFPRLRTKWMKRPSKMALEAVSAMERIEKDMEQRRLK